MRNTKVPLVVIAVYLLGDCVVAQDPAKPTPDAILTSQVRATIEAKCIQCHGDELDKPEAEFGYARDLERIASNPEFIVRKEPQNSEFFRLIRDDEMPPADSKVASMTPDEKKTIRQWIVAGAPHALPTEWKKIVAENLANTGKKPTQAEPPKHTSRLPPEIADKALAIEILDKPAKEIFMRIEELAEIRIDYQSPKVEPNLSIRMTKDGTVGEALNYLSLNGNLALMWKDKTIRIVPNPGKPSQSNK